MGEVGFRAWKHPSARSEPEGWGKKASQWRVSSIYGMLVPKQDEEDILVGGVPGTRNRGLSKVGRLYPGRRCGDIGAVRDKESIYGGQGSSHNKRLVNTGKLVK